MPDDQPNTRPPSAPPSPTPSPFESTTHDMLRKMWAWMIAGNDHIPTGVSLEYALASQWLLRIGVLILLFGVGFFLNYSLEHQWIGPRGRIALASAAGLSMLATGVHMLGRRYHLLGQGLMGAGTATIYFTLYAGQAKYGLFDQATTLTAMCAVTLTAAFLAIRFESQLMAVLGILGGYGTPLLITAVTNQPQLYTYLAVLGIGVATISARQSWPWLNLLSFVMNSALVLSTLHAVPEAPFWHIYPFLVLFFLIFCTTGFLHHLVRNHPSSLATVLGLLANSMLFVGQSYWLFDVHNARSSMGLVTLSLATFYAMQVHYCLATSVKDRGMLYSFFGLSAMYLALTPVLAISSEWLVAAWSSQAFVMIWIAYKLDSPFLRRLGEFLMALAILRLGIVELPVHYGTRDDALTGSEYFSRFLERFFALGTPLAALGATARLYARAWPFGTHLPKPLRDQASVDWHHIVPPAALFLLLNLEAYHFADYFYFAWRPIALTIVWSLGFLGIMYSRNMPQIVALALLVILGISLPLKFLAWDMLQWELGPNFRYVHADSLTGLPLRCVDMAIMLSTLGLGCWHLKHISRETEDTRTVSRLMGTIVVGLSFLFLTLETNTYFYWQLPALRYGAISIAWATFALGLLVAGLQNQLSVLRYFGLSLFCVVIGKVFLVDLGQLDTFYRIIAFLILGVLTICGSSVYLSYQELFATDGKAAPTTDGHQ